MGRKTIALLCAAAVCLAVALPLASGGTRTRQAAGAGSCTVSGNVVSATALPTNTVLNFFVTDADGKDGRDRKRGSARLPASRIRTAHSAW